MLHIPLKTLITGAIIFRTILLSNYVNYVKSDIYHTTKEIKD